MPTTGPAAEAARDAIRARLEAPGHAVDNARRAFAELEAAFASGTLVRTPALAAMLADLAAALADERAGAAADGPSQRLGGKSAEAARLILRAIVRELPNA